MTTGRAAQAASNPIRVPSSPFWEIFKTFGRDELVALATSFILVALLELIFYLTTGSVRTDAQILILAFSGPIFEKIGFWFGHIKDARDVYLETPEELREPFNVYAETAFWGGLKSLGWDVCVHDPIYLVTMIYGMQWGIPGFILVPLTFGFAVLIVAVLQVLWVEYTYHLFKKNLYVQGFELEQYNEARFSINGGTTPEEIITKLRDRFLPEEDIKTLEYTDIYYECEGDAPEFNARKAELRIRKRTFEDGWMETAQVVFTRAREDKGTAEQHRFFPKSKDKLYLILNETIKPDSFSWLPAPSQRVGKITFTRTLVYNSNSILISVDAVKEGSRSYNVVELKAYPGQERTLKEAMRFIMTNFIVIQTTDSKLELAKKAAKLA